MSLSQVNPCDAGRMLLVFEHNKLYYLFRRLHWEGNMVECADLEIGVHRYDPTSYTLEFRFCQPNSDAETRIDRGFGR